MQDILLQKFFEPERWETALEIGLGKGIDKTTLRQLTTPDARAAMYIAVRDGNYEVAPPHMAQIPKDDGTYRTVYVNENVDRIFLSIANDLLFEMCHEMIHKSCKSYQKGTGCGKVVQEVSNLVVSTPGAIIGFKSDLSKYFDSVPIRYIDAAFDAVEKKLGHSAIIDVLRKYYHADLCFDLDGNLITQYQSLKQGCAVASFLADVVLYHIDDAMSKLDGFYVRYSDDCLFIGSNYNAAMKLMSRELGKMDMTLNPKKVEYLDKEHWFKFLGFSIKGSDISLSKSRIHSFQKEIEKRTIKKRGISLHNALNSVNSYLYKGNGEFSWATQVLGTINVKHDVDKLNGFVMDCLRAVQTGKTKLGGLGYRAEQDEGCIERGTGKNVRANREKTEPRIEGYYSLGCMQNALRTRRAAYETLVRSM